MNFEISRVYRDIIEEVARAIDEDTENIGLSRDQIQDLKICWGRRLREMTTPIDHPNNYQFRALQDGFRSSSSLNAYRFRHSSDNRSGTFENRTMSYDNRKSSQRSSDEYDNGKESSDRMHYQGESPRHCSDTYSYDEVNERSSYYREINDGNYEKYSVVDEEVVVPKISVASSPKEDMDNISSDELFSDSDNDSDIRMEQAHPNYMMCLYVKVDKNKFKWRVKLKQGFLNIGQSEYVFDSAHGDLSWC